MEQLSNETDRRKLRYCRNEFSVLLCQPYIPHTGPRCQGSNPVFLDERPKINRPSHSVILSSGAVNVINTGYSALS